MPLILWKQNWKNAFQRCLLPLGHSDFDYHDPLIIGHFSEDQYDEFWNKLFEEVDRINNIDRVYISGITKVPVKGNSRFYKEETCPFLTLSSFSDKGEDFLLSLKTSLRGDIRRQLRRLQENGDVAYRVLNSQSPDLKEQLQKLLFFHSIRWPKAYKAPRFHENLIQYGLKNGIVHFSVIYFNNKPISWHLGFAHRTTFYYYMPVIDPEYQSYSPGKLHLYWLNCWAIKNKLEIFDHLRGEENYKAGWTDQIAYIYKTEIETDKIMSKIKRQLIDFKNKLG
jgi:hypothetical protein